MRTPLIAFRLLVAAAWLDGELHPSEALLLAQYLQRLALPEAEYQQQLVYLGQRPAADTSALWVEQFQKAHPNPWEQEQAVKAVQQMMQADGRVLAEEEKLLDQLRAAFQDERTLLQKVKDWLRTLVLE